MDFSVSYNVVNRSLMSTDILDYIFVLGFVWVEFIINMWLNLWAKNCISCCLLQFTGAVFFYSRSLALPVNHPPLSRQGTSRGSQWATQSTYELPQVELFKCRNSFVCSTFRGMLFSLVEKIKNKQTKSISDRGIHEPKLKYGVE